MSPMAKLTQPHADASPKAGNTPAVKTPSTPPLERLTNYIKGVRSEWTKITWPTWPQVWSQTLVVLVMVSLMTLVLAGMDKFFQFVLIQIVPHQS